MKKSDVDSANELYVDATVDAAEGMEKLTRVVEDNIKAVEIDTKQTKSLTHKKKDLTYVVVDSRDAHEDDIRATKELTGAKEDLSKAIKEQSENVGDFSNTSTDAGKANKDFAKFMKDSVSAMKAEMKETRAQMKEERASRKSESDERKRKAKLDKEEYQAKSEALKEEKAASKLEKERLALEKERIRAQRERDKIQSQLEKHQTIVDYSKKLNSANKRLAELVDREHKKREQLLNDIERESESDEELRKIKDKYRRQAAKQYPKQMGLFEKMGKSIDKFAKTTESASARIGISLLKSGTGFLSDKLDKMTDVPIIKQAKGAYKFVRNHKRGAKEAKRQRKIREEAQRLRKKDLAGMKDPSRFDNSFVGSGDISLGNVEKSINKMARSGKEKEILSELKTANETLIKIYDHLIFKSIVGIAGSFMSKGGSLAADIGKGVSAALGAVGLTKALNKIAGIDRKLPGSGKINGPKILNGPKGEPVGIGKGRVFDGEYEDITHNKSPSKPEAPKNPSKFSKIKNGASKAISKLLTGKNAAKTLLKMGARFAGPIGAAMLIYDIADSVGLVDKAEKFIGEAWNDMFEADDLPKADALTPTQASMMSEKSKARATAYGYYGTSNNSTYSYNTPAPIGESTHVIADRLENRVSSAESRIESEKQAAMNKTITDAVNMNVVSNQNINTTNNYGSSFKFDNSIYQSIQDRGIRFQR